MLMEVITTYNMIPAVLLKCLYDKHITAVSIYVLYINLSRLELSVLQMILHTVHNSGISIFFPSAMFPSKLLPVVHLPRYTSNPNPIFPFYECKKFVTNK